MYCTAYFQLQTFTEICPKSPMGKAQLLPDPFDFTPTSYTGTPQFSKQIAAPGYSIPWDIKSLASECVCRRYHGCSPRSILMKNCTDVWSLKSKNKFVWGKIRRLLPLFRPNFQPHNAFSMGKSNHCSKHGSTVQLIAQTTRLTSSYTPKIEKCHNPYFTPTTQKWGSGHSQWEYVCPRLTQRRSRF